MATHSNVLVLGIFLLASPALKAKKPPFTSATSGGGCAVESLTRSEHAKFQVQGVSWDGAWLSYTEERGQDDDGKPIRVIYLLDLQSGEKQSLQDSVTNSGAFSPDGRYLVSAFEMDSERTDIYEIELESQRLRAITTHDEWDWLPSYSPDGSTILFNSYRIDGQSELFLYDRASGELKQLTDDSRYDAHGEFSPDGSKILFHRMMSQKEEGGYDFELFVMDVESGEERQISAGSPFEESYASWAPDSEHVVFSSDQDGKPEKHNLYVLGPDGEIVSRLTKGDWKDSYAFWTRDGKYIYFNSDRDGVSNIYRIPMDGLSCAKVL
jgi:Tol biopolymer transport system component